MKLSTVEDWLKYIASIHSKNIELGLERVKKVADRLGVLNPDATVIIIGGTNGKGSTVAALEAIYRAANYQTGAFTTPFLFKHNEQVRINGKNADDDLFLNAFPKVEAARGDITLTQFEFNTLTALCIFKELPLDVLLLEIGLGGRLDAVNILDADAAIVTSISIDHTEWLGTTREAIGAEKAPIFRPHTPAICGDPTPPQSLVDYAKKINAQWVTLNQDFRFEENVDGTWLWISSAFRTTYPQLPVNNLLTQNMATALMCITLLQKKLPVDKNAIVDGLKNLSLLGRMQIKPGKVTEIVDVAHNEASVSLLAQRLSKMPCTGKTLAVFSMLADKEIEICIEQMRNSVDFWLVGQIHYERGMPLARMRAAFAKQGITAIHFYDSVQAAHAAAKEIAQEGDRILTFGSFHTVAEAGIDDI